MIVQSENHSYFKRIGNVLIEVLSTGAEVPVFSFKQNFIDLQIVGKEPLKYLNKYIEMFPELVEKIELKIQTEQLKLF